MALIPLLIGIPALGSLLLVTGSAVLWRRTGDVYYAIPAGAGLLSLIGVMWLLASRPITGNAWNPIVWFLAGLLALLAVYARQVTRAA